MYVDYWFEVVDEESDLCGEEFFVEVRTDEIDTLAVAWDIARENFPNERLKCYGRISEEQAEMLGYDTY